MSSPAQGPRPRQGQLGGMGTPRSPRPAVRRGTERRGVPKLCTCSASGERSRGENSSEGGIGCGHDKTMGLATRPRSGVLFSATRLGGCPSHPYEAARKEEARPHELDLHSAHKKACAHNLAALAPQRVSQRQSLMFSNDGCFLWRIRICERQIGEGQAHLLDSARGPQRAPVGDEGCFTGTSPWRRQLHLCMPARPCMHLWRADP